MLMDCIEDAAVIGVPDLQAGELIKGFIVLKKDFSANEETIHKFLKQHLAPYKQLTGGIKFVDHVPRNILGKISREILKKWN